MSSVQTNASTSDFETIYPSDSEATEKDKMSKIVRGYQNGVRSEFLKMRSAGYSVNIYGYIKTEVQMNSQTEKAERAAMQARLNYMRDSLMQMGIPNDKLWVGGVTFSSNWGGQINISVKKIESNPLILPSYPPYVPSIGPSPKPSTQEQWLDAEGSLGVDALKGEMTVEVELSVKENSILKTKKLSAALKLGLKPDGSLSDAELGAELVILKQEIAKSAVGGVIQNVKIKVAASGYAKVKFDDLEKAKTELNAKLKAVLSADLGIPSTKIKFPVEVSISIDIAGKPSVGANITIFRW